MCSLPGVGHGFNGELNKAEESSEGDRVGVRELMRHVKDKVKDTM